MRAYLDVPFERIAKTPAKTADWRFRLYEAAANASMTVVENSLRHNNPARATQWMGRLQHFRDKARLYS